MRGDLATSAAGLVAPTTAALPLAVEVTAATVAVLGSGGGSVLCAAASGVLFSCIQVETQLWFAYRSVPTKTLHPRLAFFTGSAAPSSAAGRFAGALVTKNFWMLGCWSGIVGSRDVLKCL